MWILFAFLSAIFASIMTILMKIGLKDIDANLATTLRTTFVVVFCWGFVLISGVTKEIKTISSKTWLYLLLAGIATFLTWTFYFLALQKGNTSKVLAIDRFSIIITVILSVVILKETITLKMILGMISLIIGIVLVVF